MNIYSVLRIVATLLFFVTPFSFIFSFLAAIKSVIDGSYSKRLIYGILSAVSLFFLLVAAAFIGTVS